MTVGEIIAVAVTGFTPGGAAIYIMTRIARKIEARLDQVENHETRLAVVERVCQLRHDDEHSRHFRAGSAYSP